MLYLMGWLFPIVLLAIVLCSHLFLILSLNACSCCLNFPCMLHGKCVFCYSMQVCIYKTYLSPNRINLGPNNLQNSPSKIKWFTYIVAFAMALFSFFFSLQHKRDVCSFPVCRRTEVLNLFYSSVVVAVDVCLHKITESQTELDQRSVLSSFLSESIKMSGNESRTSSYVFSTFKHFTF